MFFFFFSSRRRHTRLTCDWSSDVCSSDLGVSDLQVLALYTVLGSVTKGHRLIINLGMSFPTGSIDEKNTIMGETFTLEYPMQLGSGTYDFRPGLTYLGESKKWAWGAET